VTYMRLSYERFQPSPETTAIGEKLADVIFQAGIPYQEAIEALECAQRSIETQAKLVKK